MKVFRKLVSIVAAATVLTSSLAFSISAQAAQVDDSAAVASEPNIQENAGDGVILHAFNWSYNSIKQNLPQIAAAGYSTVQTSPVTQPKDFGPWSD
ncbi:MAG: alpha-amylase, partial [Ruminococcus sp.]|nr:alpha-amylase [Ruminococcus sp.]